MDGDSFPHWLFRAVYVLTWLFIPHILFRKKNPASALAWIWAILLFPIVGAFLYYAFGTNRISRKYLRRKSKARLNYERPADSVGGSASTPELDREARQVMGMLEKITGRKTTCANQLEILVDATAFYPALLREIEAAKQFIHIQFYIWNSDDTGGEFLAALVNAAKRGVEVRLLVDEIGSIGVKASFFKPLINAGGRFSWFLTLHLLRNRFFLNLRNHRKLTIIDGRVAFLGGLNIGDEYLGKSSAGYWRDTHFRVEGPCIPQLQEVFADDWYFATEEKILAPSYYPEARSAGSEIVQVVDDGPDRPMFPIHLMSLNLLGQATSRVWVETPYFTPYMDMIAQLQMAAFRGLDVRLILAGKPDVPYMLHIGHSYYEDLLKAGVRIFEYQKGILHSKLMIADDCWSFIGSANMDIRSFRLNFELNLAIYDRELARQLESQMTKDLAECREIHLKEFQARPWKDRAKESVLRLLSPAV